MWTLVSRLHFAFGFLWASFWGWFVGSDVALRVIQVFGEAIAKRVCLSRRRLPLVFWRVLVAFRSL